MSVGVYSGSRGDQLSLSLLSSSYFIAEEQLLVLLSRLCDTLIRFSANPEGVWGDCQRRKVEGETIDYISSAEKEIANNFIVSGADSN